VLKVYAPWSLTDTGLIASADALRQDNLFVNLRPHHDGMVQRLMIQWDW
jgi:hypothetical protein